MPSQLQAAFVAGVDLTQTRSLTMTPIKFLFAFMLVVVSLIAFQLYITNEEYEFAIEKCKITIDVYAEAVDNLRNALDNREAKLDSLYLIYGRMRGQQ
jgi:hypothetical protein